MPPPGHEQPLELDDEDPLEEPPEDEELDDEDPLDEPPEDEEEEPEEAAQTIFWKLLPVPPLL